MERIQGFEFVASAPPGERINSFVTYHDRIFVATDRAVYELVEKELIPLDLMLEDTNETTPNR